MKRFHIIWGAFILKRKKKLSNIIIFELTNEHSTSHLVKPFFRKFFIWGLRLMSISFQPFSRNFFFAVCLYYFLKSKYICSTKNESLGQVYYSQDVIELTINTIIQCFNCTMSRDLVTTILHCLLSTTAYCYCQRLQF